MILNKIIKSAGYSLLASVLFLASCKREEGIVGPEYVIATSNTSATGFATSAGTVDFSAGETISASATINEKVTWIVTFTGKTSGAVKEFTGTGTTVDVSGVSWNGNHDGVNFFMAEEVEAKLSFLGSTVSYSSNVTVSGIRDFDDDPNVVHAAYTDFESGSEIGYPLQFSFDNNLTGDDQSQVEWVNDASAPSGNYYFRINGKPDAAGFFLGGVQHRKSTFFTTWSNPDSVWVNFYVLGAGSGSTGTAILEVHEADESDGDNVYDDPKDDAFVYTVPLNFTGWKLFSAKYSSLVPSEVAAYGGSGDKVKEPHRVHHVQLAFKTATASIPVYGGGVDYVTFTYGGPFDPSNL